MKEWASLSHSFLFPQAVRAREDNWTATVIRSRKCLRKLPKEDNDQFHVSEPLAFTLSWKQEASLYTWNHFISLLMLTLELV